MPRRCLHYIGVPQLCHGLGSAEYNVQSTSLRTKDDYATVIIIKRSCHISLYLRGHNVALHVLCYQLPHYYGFDDAPVSPYVLWFIESVVENDFSDVSPEGGDMYQILGSGRPKMLRK